LIEQELSSVLGLARRAGLLTIGVDEINKKLKKNKEGLLVLLASDASSGVKRSVTAKMAEGQSILINIPLTCGEVSRAIGTTSTQIVALSRRSGLGEKIQALLAEGGNMLE
jgi:ribosomal protein L7Ae-like RNA K-turn-binding protein